MKRVIGRKMTKRQRRGLYAVGLRHMPNRPGLGLLIILVAFGLFLAQEYFGRPAPGPIEEAYFQARVVRVSDGDSLTVRTADGREAKLRLYGVDAPEMNQPHGPEAKKFLDNLVGGQEINVRRQDIDQYGRLVARVFLGQTQIDQTLVEAGQAWVYERYCDRPWCADLRRRQAAAKKNKFGLWRKARPVPPWVWRKNKS